MTFTPPCPNCAHGALDDRCTIDAVIAHYPASIFVLNAFGIDTCCGGSETIGAAARYARVDPSLLLSSLHAAIGT